MPEKYTQEQMEAAFKLVQPRTHWKDQINAFVPGAHDTNLLHQAVIHFTGSVPVIRQASRRMNGKLVSGLHVTAEGYWAVCGT